jgi:RNA polymerase sigma-70 factor (ECF subfamily)
LRAQESWREKLARERERELLNRAEGADFGTVELLERAINCWGDDVLRLAISTLGNRADAEDVFQTVFLRLFCSGKRFSDDEHTKAWLLRVTINCCKDELKGARRRRVVPLEAAAAVSEAQIPSGGSGDNDFAEADDNDANEQLRKALAELPIKQRGALHLFYHDGYNTNEIATIMDESPSTVRSHLHRARQSLRMKLGEHDE